MTIQIFCKKSMNKEANRLRSNGTINQHINQHIAEVGKSATDSYNVKLSTSGMITVVAA